MTAGIAGVHRNGRRFPGPGGAGAAVFRPPGRALVAVLLLFAAGARGADEFARAESEYKAGKFDEAAGLYRQILEGGQFAPELFFNLGNAVYKQGLVGEAVLNYRRAWMFAPRDPDIRANLRFAMEKAGAAGPDLSLPARALLKLGVPEWAALAMAAYWLAAALFIACILRKRPQGLVKASAAAAAAGVVALAGLLQWRSLRSEPELVVKARVQALFAPMAESTPHFALPEGSIVRELDRAGEWVRVRSGPENGWIPAKNCERVCAWKKQGGM